MYHLITNKKKGTEVDHQMRFKEICVYKPELKPKWNHIGDVMVSTAASSAVVRGLEPRSGQTNLKDYKINICCFSAKHTALRKQNKDFRLARNQDNISDWIDMFTR